MNTVKEEVKTLLERLPDDCTIEDIQYHLYVLVDLLQKNGHKVKDHHAACLSFLNITGLL